MKRATICVILITVLSFFISSFAEAVARPNKAVIIAGSGPTAGSDWDTARGLSNYVYNALKGLYFNDAEIQYLSADSNSNDKGVDGYADLQGLEKALTQWAVDANDVLIYMTGDGQFETFSINKKESLSANILDQWITVLQSQIPGRVVIVYDADYSGSFVPALNVEDRTVIYSSQADQEAYFDSNGPKSFSMYFINGIVIGMDVYVSYQRAQTAIRFFSYSYDTIPWGYVGAGYRSDGKDQISMGDPRDHILGGVKYFIEPGLNAISVSGHLYTAESLAQVINESNGTVTAVSRWDGKQYVEYWVGTNKGDYYIEPGVAYFIYSVNSSEWFAPRDKVACQKHYFEKGNNFVGFPEGTEYTASSLTAALAEKGHSVKYIQDINRDLTYFPRSNKNDFRITPGDGYIVNSINKALINTCR